MPDTETSKLIVEHYRDTIVRTTAAYQQRNYLLLLLLAAIGATALLTFRTSTIEAAFLKWLAAELKQPEANVKQGLPFAVVESLGLTLVFFALVGFYQRSSIVQLYYSYLARLETAIQMALGLPQDYVAFTLESSFYRSHRPWFLATVSYWYVVVIAMTLLALLIGKIRGDLYLRNWWLLGFDIVLSIAITFFFVGYAHDALKTRNDAEAIVPSA